MRDTTPARTIETIITKDDSAFHPMLRMQLRMICNVDEDYVWRVMFTPDNSIYMTYIGFSPIDSSREYRYDTYDDAPEWVKDRLAVLNMMPPNPKDSPVFGVGRRIDPDTFWIVQPMETIGNDP